MIRYIRAEPLDRRPRTRAARALARGVGRLRLRQARDHRDGDATRWLGFVELSLVGPGKGSRDDDVEIGYFVEPARWGEGIATEAALATRDEAFDRCGIDELIGRCRVENVASARVLTKVGFRRLRLFELADGIIVEIHRFQRDDWTAPVRPPRGIALDDGPATGAEYRETG